MTEIKPRTGLGDVHVEPARGYGLVANLLAVNVLVSGTGFVLSTLLGLSVLPFFAYFGVSYFVLVAWTKALHR